VLHDPGGWGISAHGLVVVEGIRTLWHHKSAHTKQTKVSERVSWWVSSIAYPTLCPSQYWLFRGSQFLGITQLRRPPVGQALLTCNGLKFR
jgi:hypothetical protein